MSDLDEARAEFSAAVNMTASELSRWLDTDESKSVGAAGSGTKSSPGGEESKGHESGRMIVHILGKKKADLDDDDMHEMRRVAGYVKRHLAQRPDGDVTGTRWRFSLMNWGHDPLKD